MEHKIENEVRDQLVDKIVFLIELKDRLDMQPGMGEFCDAITDRVGRLIENLELIR